MGQGRGLGIPANATRERLGVGLMPECNMRFSLLFCYWKCGDELTVFVPFFLQFILVFLKYLVLNYYTKWEHDNQFLPAGDE
jgi:hypothetical protein